MKARVALAVLAALLPQAAAAHSFGRMYNLPVPLWLYAWGAAGALLLSFVAAAFFIGAGWRESRALPLDRLLHALRRARARTVLRALALAALLLCIVSGFFGSPNPYLNINMTLFWIVFVLGYAYLTAAVGDVFGHISPWRTLAEGIGCLWKNYGAGRYVYPQRLSHWPALVLYMGFIWVELFGHSKPLSLAVLLSGYTALNLVGVWLWGARDWLRHGEFFGVFLRLTATMAPLEHRDGRLRLRWPFAGVLDERPKDFALLTFCLFMLSSTAYDGLRSTAVWGGLFWNDAFGLLTPLLGKPPIYAFVELRPWYLLYESCWMLASPFVYLAVYLVFIAASKFAARSALPVRELALRFAYTLLPIALVYNITHYYTLILTQGVKIVSLLSDPFGFGWNLLGTAGLWRAPILPDMGWVWHSQVGLILFGHVVSVVLAHLEALRTFGSPRAATLSQLPMLGLMVLFTTFGLWILAQPIQTGG